MPTQSGRDQNRTDQFSVGISFFDGFLDVFKNITCSMMCFALENAEKLSKGYYLSVCIRFLLHRSIQLLS